MSLALFVAIGSKFKKNLHYTTCCPVLFFIQLFVRRLISLPCFKHWYTDMYSYCSLLSLIFLLLLNRSHKCKHVQYEDWRVFSLIKCHEEDQLTSIRHIRRLTHPTRTANLGSGSSGSSTSGSSGNPSVSRSSRSAMMQLIELPSLPTAGLSASGRDQMDPIAG